MAVGSNLPGGALHGGALDLLEMSPFWGFFQIEARQLLCAGDTHGCLRVAGGESLELVDVEAR